MHTTVMSLHTKQSVNSLLQILQVWDSGSLCPNCYALGWGAVSCMEACLKHREQASNAHTAQAKCTCWPPQRQLPRDVAAAVWDGLWQPHLAVRVAAAACVPSEPACTTRCITQHIAWRGKARATWSI